MLAVALDYVPSDEVGCVVSKHATCSRDFPQGCSDCPDYEEIYPTLDSLLSGCFGLSFGPAYIIKKCRRFNWKYYERTKDDQNTKNVTGNLLKLNPRRLA